MLWIYKQIYLYIYILYIFIHVYMHIYIYIYTNAILITIGVMILTTYTWSESIVDGSGSLGLLDESFGKDFAFGVGCLFVVDLVDLAAIFLLVGCTSTGSSEDDTSSSVSNFNEALSVLAFAPDLGGGLAIVPFVKCNTNEGYVATVDL